MNQRNQFESIDLSARLAMHRSRRLQELLAHLASLHFDAADPVAVGQAFHIMVNTGFDDLPQPGCGQTAERWNRIAAVASHDLNLVRLFESHTDALAILAELGENCNQPGWYWGVWANDAPQERITATPITPGEVLLNGGKSWCCGAALISHALVTAWEPDGTAGLYAVALNRPGITVNTGPDPEAKLQPFFNAEVHFKQTRAIRIASGCMYTERPGFWQGGIGLAAAWFGAATTIGQAAMRGAEHFPDPERNAHLGKILVALGSAAAVLREAAAAIDHMPRADMRWIALRTRLDVEYAVRSVLEQADRALSATPLQQDAHVVRLLADLPLFMQQDHTERDPAELGEYYAQRNGNDYVLSDLLEESRLWQI